MILDKDVLVNNIVTELSDNSTGQISPNDIRHNLLDIIDSVHLLTIGRPINGSNFGTDPTRTTRVGEDALSKINLSSYFSIDNTAIGYASLRSNYQGIKNTAVGSHSLFCNIYGEYNSAVGYSALGGNVVGIGNVGIGSYSLNNNRGGNFNIAIGHGAGYYLTNNTNNKLFIASHPIDSGYICSNPLGSGLTPLIYGDLSELKLGIGVTNLVNNATLQIGGNTIPSSGNIYNLGSPSYRWNSLYTKLLDFDNTVYLSGLNGAISLYGSLLPSRSTESIGSPSKIWNSGYFDNLVITGSIQAPRLVAYENCNYFCHTINLANSASGNISLDGGGSDSLFEYAHEDPIVYSCGLPSDLDASGAGITIKTSGVGYNRLYSLLFNPPDQTLSCLQNDTPFSRASWLSNVSIHINSGSHLKTDRIIFPSSINIVNSDGCYGIFSRNSGIFFSKNNLVSNGNNPSGYLAGVGSINFYAPSGDFTNYIVNIASPESGVTIKQRFLTGIKSKVGDNLNNNIDKLRGFELQYIDDSSGYNLGPTSDRFIIGSYNNTSELVNALTLMKNNQTEGLFGITNLTPVSKNVLPSTSLNIRSSNNAIGRFTAENQASTISAIQLLGKYNCLYDGFEASYLNNSGIADLSIFKDSGKSIFLRFYENNSLGLFTSSGLSNEMFTIGDSFNNDAVISIYQNNTVINSTANYGKLYVKPNIKTKQSHSLYFIDGSGNNHNLVVNIFDNTDGRFLYTDPSGNTFGGLNSVSQRFNIVGAERNTSIGNNALFSLINGDDNTTIGRNAGSGITIGNKNTIIGSNSATGIVNGNNNIIIGANIANNTSLFNNNIIIGSNGTGNGVSGDYQLLLGNSGITLLHGVLGPTNTSKYLSIPSGGRFIVYDSTNTDSIELKANYIDVVDRGGSDYPDNNLTFRFIGNSSAEIFSLNHSVGPMTNTTIYQVPSNPRPYAELNGDLKLRGAIRFSDNTSVDSAKFLQDINTLQSGLVSTNYSLNGLLSSFVEGYTDSKINAPLNGNNPTSGILYLKNEQWNTYSQVPLINRDSTSVIHSGAYVIAIKINNEFRPLWVSSSDPNCSCCK